VTAGPGDAARLLPLLVAAAAKHSSARLVHLAGERVAVDLVAALAARGIAARRVIAYRAVAAKTLPEPVRAALAAGGLDAVLLMSPRTAATFAALTAAAGLAEQARTLDHLCLSEAVAAGLGDPPPPKVHIAGSPTQEEMLALVGSLAANSGPSR
jgi:uroporphyrinogen-III synthase